MKVADLRFDYPEELIATKPMRPSRVLCVEDGISEISFQQLLEKIPAGDILVLNNTKVLKRRIFTDQFEIVFLKQKSERQWEVLFPSRKLQVGSQILLPENTVMTILEKGRPQIVELNHTVDEAYFERVAELPLPPYIQKIRNERVPLVDDQSWYQTSWAKSPGSLAAPTASLHFNAEDIGYLKKRGVRVCELTLHVGLGTFLPVLTEDLDDHLMHKEVVEISARTWNEVISAKKAWQEVWAMGTTVARALESVAIGKIKASADGHYTGETDLKIQPGFEWKVVSRLLTNFHQPESTLLALVAAFIDLETVKKAYTYAIEKKMRLFSYGDLSVWVRKIGNEKSSNDEW